MKELLPALGIYPEGEIDYLLPDPDDITDDNTNEETPIKSKSSKLKPERTPERSSARVAESLSN